MNEGLEKPIYPAVTQPDHLSENVHYPLFESDQNLSGHFVFLGRDPITDAYMFSVFNNDSEYVKSLAIEADEMDRYLTTLTAALKS